MSSVSVGIRVAQALVGTRIREGGSPRVFFLEVFQCVNYVQD